jgi:CheY-like chemotaxis protein
MAVDPSIPVLVVDDYSTMIRIIRNLLKQLGFADVDDANDGGTALAKMHAKRYGLVISDWNMEPMTGYDFLRQVRADPDLGKTPFIMVNGGVQDRERDRRAQGRRQQLHRQAVQRTDAQSQDRGGVRLFRRTSGGLKRNRRLRSRALPGKPRRNRFRRHAGCRKHRIQG